VTNNKSQGSVATYCEYCDGRSCLSRIVHQVTIMLKHEFARHLEYGEKQLLLTIVIFEYNLAQTLTELV